MAVTAVNSRTLRDPAPVRYLGYSLREPDVLVGVRQFHEFLADLFVGAAHKQVFVALHALQ